MVNILYYINYNKFYKYVFIFKYFYYGIIIIIIIILKTQVKQNKKNCLYYNNIVIYFLNKYKYKIYLLFIYFQIN